MMEKILSLLWAVALVVMLLAAIWFSAVLLIFVFGAALIFWAGMYLWAWLVRKQIVNPRPGHSETITVIETDYARITDPSEDTPQR